MQRNLLATLTLGTLGLAATTASAVPVVGVNARNQYLTFDSATPGTLTSGRPIVGLAANESVEGIDFRPTTSELFALGSFGNVYTLNTAGLGAVVANPEFNLSGAGVFLNGTSFGFDFNPSADASGANSLRIVSDAEQNLAVNVDTGGVIVATPVFFANGRDPGITGVAYTNSAPGGAPPGATLQYDIDSSGDQLVLQAFNAGTLTLVGGLGVDTTDRVGFDIFSPVVGTNTAFASLSPLGSSATNFYGINLATGQATLIGPIGSGQIVPNITVAPIPEPASFAVLGLAALPLLRRRRA